jgi:serine/threonine protein phosphatase 1
MARLLAFGDIHGCSMQLDALWAAIQPQPDDTIIFLGDYVDRGPNSKGVLDRLIAWKKQFQIVCLCGNHELMMLRSRENLDELKHWCSHGGFECLASYSKVLGRMAKIDQVPEEHWNFIENQTWNYYETDRFVFVHANLDPNVPLEEQTENYFQWEFLKDAIELPSGKTVIVGHTSQKSGEILDLGSTVCIDTYAHGGGHLTCLDCSSWQYWQANLIGRVSTGELPKR